MKLPPDFPEDYTMAQLSSYFRAYCRDNGVPTIIEMTFDQEERYRNLLPIGAHQPAIAYYRGLPINVYTYSSI